MNRPFRFLVDTGSELDEELRSMMDVGILCTGISISNKDMLSYPEWTGISKEEFFYNLSTNNVKIYQPSINVWKDEIEKIFAAGEDVLFLGMSSRFAGGIKNLNIAKNLLKPKYPESRLEIVDSGLVGAGYKCLSCAIADWLSTEHVYDLDKAISGIENMFLGKAHSFWFVSHSDAYIKANRGIDKDFSLKNEYIVIASKDNSFHIAYETAKKNDAIDFIQNEINNLGKVRDWEFVYSPDWNDSDIEPIIDSYAYFFGKGASHRITYQSPTVTAVGGPLSYSVGVLV